ncbi:FCD domain-containing protein [Nonomuraea sp. NPDC049129]|uniref:FCD domain-containing protein n=1 Tax=Nonomuraea sp. NPDC049129 TaxID=3155272 RepID=UPI0033C99502
MNHEIPDLDTDGLTDAGPAAAERAQAEVDRAAAAGDVLEMAEANRRFHMTIFEWPGLPRLVRPIRTLWDSTDAYRSLYYGEEPREGPPG